MRAATWLDRLTSDHVANSLDGICGELKIRVKANIDDFRISFFERSGLSRATILGEGATQFEDQWRTFEGRIALVPGKQVLARVND